MAECVNIYMAECVSIYMVNTRSQLSLLGYHCTVYFVSQIDNIDVTDSSMQYLYTLTAQRDPFQVSVKVDKWLGKTVNAQIFQTRLKNASNNDFLCWNSSH